MTEDSTQDLLERLNRRQESIDQEQKEFDDALKATFAISDTTFQVLGSAAIPNQRYLSNTAIIRGQQVAPEIAPGQNVGVSVPRTGEPEPERPRKVPRTIELFCVSYDDRAEFYVRKGESTRLVKSWRHSADGAAWFVQSDEVGSPSDFDPIAIFGFGATSTGCTLSFSVSNSQSVVNYAAGTYAATYYSQLVDCDTLHINTYSISASTTSLTGTDCFVDSNVYDDDGDQRTTVTSDRTFVVPPGSGSASGTQEESRPAFWGGDGVFLRGNTGFVPTAALSGSSNLSINKINPDARGFISAANSGQVSVTAVAPSALLYGNELNLSQESRTLNNDHTRTSWIDPTEILPHPFDWRSHIANRDFWAQLAGYNPINTPPVPANSCTEAWGDQTNVNITADFFYRIIPTGGLSFQDLLTEPVPAEIEQSTYSAGATCEIGEPIVTNIIVEKINTSGYGVPLDKIKVLDVIPIP